MLTDLPHQVDRNGFPSAWRRRDPSLPGLANLIVPLLLLLAGCGYPRVGPAAYELAKGLDTVVNLRQAENLPRVRTALDDALATGTISEREHGLLIGLVEVASDGRWEQAESEVRRLLRDQNGR